MQRHEWRDEFIPESEFTREESNTECRLCGAMREFDEEETEKANQWFIHTLEEWQEIEKNDPYNPILKRRYKIRYKYMSPDSDTWRKTCPRCKPDGNERRRDSVRGFRA